MGANARGVKIRILGIFFIEKRSQPEQRMHVRLRNIYVADFFWNSSRNAGACKQLSMDTRARHVLSTAHVVYYCTCTLHVQGHGTCSLLLHMHTTHAGTLHTTHAGILHIEVYYTCRDMANVVVNYNCTCSSRRLLLHMCVPRRRRRWSCRRCRGPRAGPCSPRCRWFRC